jgi:hypothetical protein
VGSKEGEDRRERGDIVGGRAGFGGGVVDVSTEDGDSSRGEIQQAADR